MSKTPLKIKSLARAHTETAINTLSKIMTNETSSDSARVVAAQALLDRGWGKAPQSMDITAKVEEVNKEQKDAAVAAAISVGGD